MQQIGWYKFQYKFAPVEGKVTNVRSAPEVRNEVLNVAGLMTQSVNHPFQRGASERDINAGGTERDMVKL